MTTARRIEIVPKKGERALITGTTGSGKTSFAVHLLKQIEDAPAIIYDTKIEPKFQNLANSIVVETMEECLEVVHKGEHDYVIVRPPVEYLTEPRVLDEMLKFHYRHLQGLVAYIDEAYTFHSNGRAHAGLIGLLTRGRSKGITTIISTQRPVWLSKFCLTESQRMYIFRLGLKDDRKYLENMIEDYSQMRNPSDYYFNYIDFATMREPVYCKPVRLDEIAKSGYTDSVEDDATAHSQTSIWI